MRWSSRSEASRSETCRSSNQGSRVGQLTRRRQHHDRSSAVGWPGGGESDPGADRAAENAVAQARYVVAFIEEQLSSDQRFTLTPDLLCTLNRLAVDGIVADAGEFRSANLTIAGSRPVPPDWSLVPKLVDDCCRYVNNCATDQALHQAAHVMWRVNWIHPFADGNGRTARAATYVVFSVSQRILLPGRTILPERIARERIKYHKVLEEADRAWKKSETVALQNAEGFLDRLIRAQLSDVD
jgi:Fic family protein